MHKLDWVSVMMSLAFQYALRSLWVICAYDNLHGHLAFSELHFTNGSQLPDVHNTAKV